MQQHKERLRLTSATAALNGESRQRAKRIHFFFPTTSLQERKFPQYFRTATEEARRTGKYPSAFHHSLLPAPPSFPSAESESLFFSLFLLLLRQCFSLFLPPPPFFLLFMRLCRAAKKAKEGRRISGRGEGGGEGKGSTNTNILNVFFCPLDGVTMNVCSRGFPGRIQKKAN